MSIFNWKSKTIDYKLKVLEEKIVSLEEKCYFLEFLTDKEYRVVRKSYSFIQPKTNEVLSDVEARNYLSSEGYKYVENFNTIGELWVKDTLKE